MSEPDAGKRALELFKKGYHCSQAIFVVGSEHLGKNTPEFIPALAPFGGGMGGTGDVCGALIGALSAIGLAMGKGQPDQRDHRSMWSISFKMVKAFHDITRPYGGYKCMDIVQVDWRDPKQIRAFRKDPERRAKCHKVIALTADKLVELLDRT